MTIPDERRRVPRTDRLLTDPRLVEAAERLGRPLVKAAVAAAQEQARTGAVAMDEEAVLAAALAALPGSATSLRPVLNATGVIVHTNLGRAPLSPAAMEALQQAAGYVDVEYDVGTGARARRGRAALDALRSAVPAAADALVVNNGAAALLLTATALAQGREIVVSRGELVEIGDGFRLPDLVQSTGARLREVGTTNRTTLDDYRAVIGPHTAFVLKVHTSNFTVTGFTSTVPVAELSSLGPPVVADIGSGLLRPDPVLPDEPDAQSTLRAGATVVTASGDKLLGGPQAGLVLGRADLVEQLRRHPAARAVRVDKLTLAALEATLRGPAPPVTVALHVDQESLHQRATALAKELTDRGVRAEVGASSGAVGGGGGPGVSLAGWAVGVAEHLVEPLRLGTPCVVGRVERGRCLLDLRCIPPDRDAELLAAVISAATPST